MSLLDDWKAKVEFDPVAWLGIEPIDVLIGLIGAVLVPFAISTASIWIPQVCCESCLVFFFNPRVRCSLLSGTLSTRQARLSHLSANLGDLTIKWSSPVIVVIMYGIVLLGAW